MINKKIKNYSKFKEPIIILGKILSIKLLSTYEIILCERKYKKILKHKKITCNLCKKLLKQACLISMCLYTFENKPAFSGILDVLKNLTFYELNFIYHQYIKINKKFIEYNQKNYFIFESIKKHVIEQIPQKIN